MKFSLLLALVSVLVFSSCSGTGSVNKTPEGAIREFSGTVIGSIQGHDIKLCPNLAGNFKVVEDNGEVSYVGISQAKNADNSIVVITKNLNSGKNVEALRVDGQVRQNSNGEIRAYFCIASGNLSEMISTEDPNSDDITGSYALDPASNVVITISRCQKNTNNCTSTTNIAYRQ